MAEAHDDFPFDYFISRSGVAAAIAAEVADVLEGAGFRIKVQDYDFGHGGDFVGDIHDALVAARHLYILHTRDYDQQHWTRKEFTNFYAAIADSQGVRRICVLKCDDSMPRGLFANVVFGDLVGVTEPARRRDVILAVASGEALRKRAEPPVLGGAMPRKNANFTGRKDVLARIKAAFDEADSATALMVVAIIGLGGVGKTSIVRAFIDEFGSDYPGIWWCGAATRTALVAALAALAARLDPKLEGEADLEKAARAALARLERTSRPFLLVYDNAEAPGAIDELLPARGAHVIVTTRRPDWGGRAHEVAVDVMAEDEAIAFLQARAGRKDEAGARRLARALGCLPLALDHGGAYVKLGMTSFDAYAKSVDKLMAKAPKDAPYPASVSATFSLAIDTAASECAAAESLLYSFAYFAPDRIPLDLVTEAVMTEEDRGEALMALAGVSLLRSDPFETGAPAVSLHRLVQAAARARAAAKGAAGEALEGAVTRVAEAFPESAYDDTKEWPRCNQLLTHVLALRDHAAAAAINTEALALLYDRAGQFLHARASFDVAKTLFGDAIAVGERAVGREHPSVAKSMNNLANVLRDSGHLADSEKLLREALDIEEKTLGREHPSFARTMTSLAVLMHDTGRLDEAEKLLREAIAVGEKTLHRSHPDVAGRLNNLALVLRGAHKLEDAEKLLREAIAHGEKSLGREHPAVVIRLNNLAALLHDTGHDAEAETLYREAIELGEKMLGRDHPDVAARLSNLANLLSGTGRAEEAEILYRRALAAFETSHGHSHRSTARVRRNLANLLLKTARAEEARRQAELALAVHADALGASHPWTQDSASTLAGALEALGQTDAAAKLRGSYGLKSTASA